MKVCSVCNENKLDTEFYKTTGNRCKKCHTAYVKLWREKNPEKVRAISKKWYHASEENRQRSIDSTRKWQKENRERDKLLQQANHLLRNYNLQYEDYLKMAETQDGKCAICSKEPSRRLDVDHDHSCCATTPTCGKCTRGLLCSNCNTAIGLLKESTELVINSLSYLQKYAQSTAEKIA